MNFSEVIGQDDVKNRLLTLIESGKMPHSLLLHGAPGCGKMALALALASHLLGENDRPIIPKLRALRLCLTAGNTPICILAILLFVLLAPLPTIKWLVMTLQKSGTCCSKKSIFWHGRMAWANERSQSTSHYLCFWERQSNKKAQFKSRVWAANKVSIIWLPESHERWMC